MNAALKYAALAAAIGLLGLVGCKKDTGVETYNHIASSAGIGLAFGSAPSQAHARFGAPTATTERGKILEDHYLPNVPGLVPPKMPDPEQVQLTLTYYDKKLVRVYNRYHPENPAGLTPPVVAEPVPGVKLGMKRSQVEAIMGKPNYGHMNDGWKFYGEDGSAVVVQPSYTEVESLKEWLSSAISLEYIEPGSDPGQGEVFDKRKKRQEKIHNL